MDPDLARWNRLLSQCQYLPDPSDIQAFISLASSIVEKGDSSSVQKVIMELAGERGLKVIDNLIGQCRSSSCEATWNTVVRPFFQTICSPNVASSAVLEQARETILGYTVGPGGRRFEPLFSFVNATLLSQIQKRHASTETCHGNLELATSMLSLLLDSSTANLVNDKFITAASALRAIVRTQEGDVTFSILQARKHMEYINARLGIGQDVPLAQSATGGGVPSRAQFVLAHDLPGDLSKEGRRHDNDFADISDINILPTSQEIMSSRAEYWPTTTMEGAHVQGLKWVIDRSFRLLREDTIGQLRDVCGNHIASRMNKESWRSTAGQSSLKTYCYPNARLERLRFDSREGLLLHVKVRQPKGVPSDEKKRRDWWDASRRLQPDSLVAVADSVGSVFFFQVVAAQNVDEREATALREQEERRGGGQKWYMPKRTSLWSDDTWAACLFKPLQVTLELLNFSATWLRTLPYGEVRCDILEFPGILLPAFEHTLKALQKLSESPVPFSSLLVPSNTGGRQLDVPPPLYAQRPGFRFNLRCLTRDGQDFWYSPNDPPEPDRLSLVSPLDPTQSLALLNSLRRGLALTEGPPGTGKSFTGASIIRVLVDHKKEANLGPIVCVTYTNHALDQVLEHLHSDGVTNLIRIGSRSQSETLSGINLANVSKKTDRTRTEGGMLGESYANLEEAASTAARPTSRVSTVRSAKSIKYFLERHEPAHHRTIFGYEGEDEDGFKQVTAEPSKALDKWKKAGSNLHTTRPIERIRHLPLSQLSQVERQTMIDHWVERIQNTFLTEIEMAQRDFESARDTQSRVHREINARCLAGADVVGITTSGMARNMELLKGLRPKVIICEEAGEVLEAHLLTSFLPSVEHVILCGDHLQLRPQISNYSLQGTHDRGKKYSLDVSLFERLVSPFDPSHGPIPFTVLQTQRRMHPSISALVRSTLYPELQDHESVESYPGIPGMRKRLFWLDHQNFESSSQQKSDMDTSYSNPFEADMITAMVTHLLRQGVYKQGEIAVITPYMSQFRHLKKRLSAVVGVTMNERDQKEFEEKEEADMDMTTQQPRTEMAKAQLLESVRVATIDNFQGEEAKVILISLVRSNEQRKVGFLKTSNRINVLLSRARHGMFIVGDAQTAATVPMWNQVIGILREGGNIGPSLPLMCERHPDTDMSTSTPDHFSQFSPDGGCILPCQKRLNCGHSCPGRCHSNMIHNATRCLEPCQRLRPNCSHECPRRCYEACGDKCTLIVDARDVTLDCRHVVEQCQCWQSFEPKTIKCKTRVKKTVPGCRHEVTVPCYVDVTASEWRCREVCGSLLPCGHTCKRSCCLCTSKDGQVSHGSCTQTCGRKFTTCRHSCSNPCHEGTDCDPCKEPCEATCSHSRCSNLCHEPCPPCAEPRCASKCPHGECTMPYVYGPETPGFLLEISMTDVD